MEKDIIELLEDLIYWETCPHHIKARIPEMIKFLNNIN